MFAQAMNHRLALGDATIKTTAGDVTMTNEGVVFVKKASGAATAVTLPASPGAGGIYPMVWIVDAKGDAGTNNITVSGASAATIDGASTYVISENYGAALFVWNGTEWNVCGQFNAVSATEIGYLNGVTAGTAAASKAMVTDANNNIASLNGITTTNATVTTETVSNLTFGDVASINAAGTVIGNATAITNSVVIVAGADDAKGVVLPATAVGKVVLVYSSQATNGLKVYPSVNSSINGGSANAAVVIEGKTLALFLGTTATNWASMFTLNT